MTNYHILLTHRAKDDIIDIGDYITYILLEPGTSKRFTYTPYHTLQFGLALGKEMGHRL